ncbi:MAG: recombination regulator RecX [Bifidobacteriaceae bacterium]|nr:recombination regulator RecX [Bifidobacteriaceae bacterium]
MKVDGREEFAREVALKSLDRAPRSRAQLEATLAKRDVDPDVARAVLDSLERVGLVDDSALAAALVRARHSERGLVGQALKAELRRKGIDPDSATAALAQVTPEDEAASAERLARKRLAATAGLPRETRLRRVAAMLAGRGHPPGLAYATVCRLLAEEGQPAAADE